ncbi:MAG: hypothetical protein Q9191_007441 [Dirinaria sp. TL-2023a]
MSNAESPTRPQKDHPNPSKGRPGPERRKGSLQSTHSSGWGWPRFVSVEVDVEEKRRQKPNEMAPVNATGEISRPEQGARNQSFQKAHEHASHPYLRHKASQNPEGSDDPARPEAVAAEEHQPSDRVSRSPVSERRSSRKAPENSWNQTNTPELEAAVETDKDLNSPGILGEQRPEGPEHTPIPAGEQHPEQQKISHRASVNSRTQEAERMAGAFPDEDTESVYSSGATDHQNDTEFQAPVKWNTLRGLESTQDSHRESINETRYRPLEEAAEESRTQVHTPSARETSSNQLNQSNGQSQPTPSSNEQELNDSFEKPTQFRSWQTFPARPGEASKYPSIRSYPTELSLRRARTDHPVDRTKEAAEPQVFNATSGESNTSSDQSTVPIATESLVEVEQTKEPGHEDSAPAAREGNEEATPRIEAREAGPRNSSVGPSQDDQEASLEDKRGELPSTGTKEAVDDAVSVAESDNPAGRTVHPGSKIEPAEVIKRVSIPDDQLLQQPSIQKRKSSVAKKVTLPAPPKIFVQSPSEATEQDITEPCPTPAAQSTPNDEYRIISRHGSIVSVQHTVNSATEKLKQPRVRRRKLYLRKARNLAARPIFLNAALGRRVGRQTKQRLRRLAKGENVEAPSIKTQANPPDSPRLRKSQSFIRKARNLVARKSFLDMAFGREISGDTKPVLRQMASGQFRVVEDDQSTEVAA